MPTLKKKPKQEIKSETLFRSAEFRMDSVNHENRTIELSFASETDQVERFFGIEILDHSKNSVRLDRLNAGAPLLTDHDTSAPPVGVIEKAWLDGKERKTRATVRFGKSARADEVYQDVLDGIRLNVSAGYRVHKMVLEEENDGKEIYRVTDWEPYEISLVAVPADTSVGVGRGDNTEHEIEIIDERKRKMPGETKPETPTATPPQIDIRAVETGAADKARKAELARITEIEAIGGKMKKTDLARKAITDGTSIDNFRKLILDTMVGVTPVAAPDADIGMSQNEIRKFSLLRAILAQADNNWADAGFERECSKAVATQMRQTPGGFFIPAEVLKRDLVVGTATAGGNLVGTDLLSGSFIDQLRNAILVRSLGATVLAGLVGDLAIPRQTGGSTAYWLAENGQPTESQQAFDQVGLTPKTVGAFTDMSRKLLQQSSLDVEAFVQSELAKTIALELDRVCINGSGTSNEPTGISNITGIGDVAGGTNGLAPAWPHIVSLETEVAIDNADVGALAYLTNSKVRGKLKTTEKAANTAQFIWENGQEPGVGMLNGYRAAASNQVPSNLTKGTSSGVCSAIIFGNFADLLIGMWGTLDVQVDPYVNGLAGGVRIRVLQDVDVAVRHPESFAAMQDALTA